MNAILIHLLSIVSIDITFVECGAPPLPSGGSYPPNPPSQPDPPMPIHPPDPATATTTESKIPTEKKTSELYFRNAKSFGGTKIKMVANVYMVTECVLLCDQDESCDFSVLETQNCILYSMNKTLQKSQIVNETNNIVMETEVLCSSVSQK